MTMVGPGRVSTTTTASDSVVLSVSVYGTVVVVVTTVVDGTVVEVVHVSSWAC